MEGVLCFHFYSMHIAPAFNVMVYVHRILSKEKLIIRHSDQIRLWQAHSSIISTI